jgi:hypothetical protein
MEKKFKSLSIFEFQKKFPDEDSCYKYLSDIKWKTGFVCPKCFHDRYSQGQGRYKRKCTRCDHQVSPTSGTLFHNVKFSLLKAFYIVYYVSTCKKGISSTELSRKLDLRQKTCWLFKPGFLNREILPNENTFSFYKIMDYTDCNDFLWPIEIFGFNVK